MYRHVFLTGPPGVGKTTIIKKLFEMLNSSGIPIDGFYTEEVRKGGRRIGFDVVTMSEKRGNLARISTSFSDVQECRVGQYVVDLQSFEHLVLPLLDSVATAEETVQKSVCVIDEIGKMELFSKLFMNAVSKILDCPGIVVLGTIPVAKQKPLPFIEKIRQRPDVKVFHITKENRDDIQQEIVRFIVQIRCSLC